VPVVMANQDALLLHLQTVLRDGDILLMQGAGDISKIAHYVADKFELYRKAYDHA